MLEPIFERALKFFGKGFDLEKYVEDFRLERLHFLDSQADIRNVILKTCFINQEENLPFVLKHGAIAHITIKLPLDIEIAGLDLIIAPRQESCKKTCKKTSNRTSTSPQPSDSVEGEDPTYAGINDKVRAISKMIKRMLCGMPVRVTDVKVRFEGDDGNRCFYFRLSKLSSGNVQQRPNNPVLSTVLSFEGASFLVGEDQVECGTGTSGSISIKLPEAESTTQKIDVNMSIKPVTFEVTTEQLQQVVTLAREFQGDQGQVSVFRKGSSSFHDTHSVFDDFTRAFMEEPDTDEFFDCGDELDPCPFQPPPISQDISKMQYTVRVRIELVSACVDGLELRLEKLGITSELSKDKFNSASIKVEDVKLIQMGMSDDMQRRHISILEKSEMTRYLPFVEPNTGGVRLMRIKASTNGDSAASFTIDASSDQAIISLRLEPVVLWVDAEVLARVSRTLSLLQPSAKRPPSPPEEHAAFRLNVSLSRSMTLMSTRSCADMILLRLEESDDILAYEQPGENEAAKMVFNLSSCSLHLLGTSNCNEIASLRSDHRKKVLKVELLSKRDHWQDRSIAKKAWDIIHDQKISEEKSSDLGENFEYTATKKPDPAMDSYPKLRELLDSTSSRHIQVLLPVLRFDFSRVENVAAFDILSRVLSLEGEDDTQTFVSVDCRKLEAVLDLSDDSKNRKLQINIENPRAVLGMALGGVPGASYFNIRHSEAEVLECVDNSSPCKVLSCNAAAIGRGDGAAGNALTSGSFPGLDLTSISWQESLLTGTLKGSTLVTVDGGFGWIVSMTAFVQRCMKPFQKPGGEVEKVENPKASSFSFDLPDIAMSFEPVDEIGEARARGVVAASALRISCTEEWDFLLKDVALHIGKRPCSSDYSTRAIRQAAYVRVARAPIIWASLTTSADGWGLDFSKKPRLYLESCEDTTEAFLSLMRNLFAPDAELSTEEEEVVSQVFKAEVMESSTVELSTEEDMVYEDTGPIYMYPFDQADTRSQGTAGDDEDTGFIYSPTIIDDYNGHDYDQAPPILGVDVEDNERQAGWYGEWSPANILNSYAEEAETSSNEGSNPKAASRISVSGLDIQWKLYGGSDWARRQRNICLELSISGLDVEFSTFGPTEDKASSLTVEVDQIEIKDESSDAPWKSILSYYSKRSRPRLTASKALNMKMVVVRSRSSSEAPAEQCRLYLALLPIHLHLDHARHITFLENFFKLSAPSPPSQPSSKAKEIVFQLFKIQEIIIRLDYNPPTCDLFDSLGVGRVVEFLSLKGVELRLKSVDLSKIVGWDNVTKTLGIRWFKDISKNKLARELAKGCALSRPVYTVGEGAAKLVSYPIKQYKRDGRLLRGLRKGAESCIYDISVETLSLGASVASGVFEIMVRTDMVLRGPGNSPMPLQRSQQPRNMQEGFKQAYDSLMQGLLKGAVLLVGDSYQVYQRERSPTRATLRAIKNSPKAILAPATAAAKALQQGFLGIRNSLDPDKYRGDT